MSSRDIVQAAAGAAGDKLYVEDVFSTYLYTGNGSTQTITNGIDLAGEGGLVWSKGRSSGLAGVNHWLSDTARGIGYSLASDSTAAQSGPYNYITLNASGYSLNTTAVGLNTSGETYASWTFRKAEKFFDVVTYTGNGSNRTIAHNLGSAPGCVIVKQTSASGQNWVVWHRAAPSGGADARSVAGYLNTTDAVNGKGTYFWSGTFEAVTATSTTFGIGNDAATNANGATYVAYLFAHNAGGFGEDGSENVISCGSFTNSGTLTTVNLGWEPQYVLTKVASTTGNWQVYDNLRGFVAAGGSGSRPLFPNTTGAESSGAGIYPTSTGFQWEAGSGTYIYIAIRRGPMKVPTSGTSVFSPTATRSSGSNQATPLFNAGWPVDLLMQGFKSGNVNAQMVIPRLTNNILRTSTTGAETNGAAAYDFGGMLGVLSVGGADNTDSTICGWNFRRAPGFFDEVCYTGTGSARTVAHNLGVVPELMIVKGRSSSSTWGVWNKDIFAANPASVLALQLAQAVSTGASTYFNSTAPTSSVFTVGTADATNGSSVNFVAYLFASCPGVSKVGSYTGNGSSQTINCGFSAGARFVLIKRTDSTGDWYVWDSVRGIVAGNDPHLSLNTTVSEVTTDDSVDTDSTGFIVNQDAATNINVSSATYIFLAVS